MSSRGAPRRSVSAPDFNRMTEDDLIGAFEKVVKSLARRRAVTAGGAPTASTMKIIINKFAILLTILTIATIRKYGHAGFQAVIDQAYPGLQKCFEKETVTGAVVTMFFDKALGIGSNHCTTMITGYKSTVQSFAIAVQTFILTTYVAAVHENIKSTGANIIKAAAYTPIVITMDVLKTVVNMYEEMLKCILMMDSEIQQVKSNNPAPALVQERKEDSGGSRYVKK